MNKIQFLLFISIVFCIVNSCKKNKDDSSSKNDEAAILKSTNEKLKGEWEIRGGGVFYYSATSDTILVKPGTEPYDYKFDGKSIFEMIGKIERFRPHQFIYMLTYEKNKPVINYTDTNLIKRKLVITRLTDDVFDYRDSISFEYPVSNPAIAIRGVPFIYNRIALTNSGYKK